jgi:Flp pilus assembly pilin Flp
MYQFFQNEQGTAAIEYSLFISLIGLVMAGALHVLGTNLLDVFSTISEGFPTVLVTEDPRKAN